LELTGTTLQHEQRIHNFIKEQKYSKHKNSRVKSIGLTEMKELVWVFSKSRLKQRNLEKSTGWAFRLFQGNTTLFEKKEFFGRQSSLFVSETLPPETWSL